MLSTPTIEKKKKFVADDDTIFRYTIFDGNKNKIVFVNCYSLHFNCETLILNKKKSTRSIDIFILLLSLCFFLFLLKKYYFWCLISFLIALFVFFLLLLILFFTFDSIFSFFFFFDCNFFLT